MSSRQSKLLPKTSKNNLQKKTARASAAISKSSRSIAANDTASIAHAAMMERIERLEKKLDESNQVNTEILKYMGEVMGTILKNQGMFYTKFLLTRLNLIELSQGKEISISRTEQIELENSSSETPDAKVTRLPRLISGRKGDSKKSLH